MTATRVQFIITKQLKLITGWRKNIVLLAWGKGLHAGNNPFMRRTSESWSFRIK